LDSTFGSALASRFDDSNRSARVPALPVILSRTIRLGVVRAVVEPDYRDQLQAELRTQRRVDKLLGRLVRSASANKVLARLSCLSAQPYSLKLTCHFN
jgi:hypothetical protein